MNLKKLAPKVAQAESFLKALANRHRLLILCEIHKGEIPVSALQSVVGLSQSALSQHLARLREDGLVKTRRESQAIFYSLANPNVSRVISLLYELYCATDCDDSEAKKKTPARISQTAPYSRGAGTMKGRSA